MDLAELSRSLPGNYLALLNDILASPAEVPSPLLASDDFPLPASATNWSIDQQFADLEARLFERQEKISETLRLMTRALDMISKSVQSFHCNTTHKTLPIAPPTRASGKNFIRACQAYFRLRPDQFPDDQTKVQWAMTYMSQDRAQKLVIVRGDPGVFQLYPYPTLHKPLPLSRVQVFSRFG